MIEEYEKSIALLEKRLEEVDSLTLCRADIMQRKKLIEDELDDLYSIVRYLKSPFPRSDLFKDLFKPFNHVASYNANV